MALRCVGVQVTENEAQGRQRKSHLFEIKQMLSYSSYSPYGSCCLVDNIRTRFLRYSPSEVTAFTSHRSSALTTTRPWDTHLHNKKPRQMLTITLQTAVIGVMLLKHSMDSYGGKCEAASFMSPFYILDNCNNRMKTFVFHRSPIRQTMHEVACQICCLLPIRWPQLGTPTWLRALQPAGATAYKAKHA